jgi:hypothetical protein
MRSISPRRSSRTIFEVVHVNLADQVRDCDDFAVAAFAAGLGFAVARLMASITELSVKAV